MSPPPHKGLKFLYFKNPTSVAAIPPFLASLKDMVSLVILGPKNLRSSSLHDQKVVLGTLESGRRQQMPNSLYTGINQKVASVIDY